MAELGQQWSDRCMFEHGQPGGVQSTGYQQLGQNLYVTSDWRKTMADGVQAWFDEKKDYNYDDNSCRPGKVCGHYTQVGLTDMEAWHL